MAKSCNILKYLVLTCLMVIVFPALSYSQIHTTRLEPAASLFSLEEAYQVAGIYWLPDYLKDNTSRDYNTNAGNDDKGGGDAEKTCETYGYASPEETDLSLYDCSDYDIKPMYGLQCYTGCVCKPKFIYTSSNCNTSAGYTLSGLSCGGKYESCVCARECCSDSMCGSNETCQNGNCVSLDPCADITCGTNEVCSNGSCVCASGYKSCNGTCISNSSCCTDSDCGTDEACSNGSCTSTCSYTVTADDCSSECKSAGSSSCVRSGTTYYASCGASKCSSDQTCSNGTCVDNCTPLNNEENCSWGTKNCSDNCGGYRSCCKTAAEYCTENGYSSGVTCEKGQTTETCPADSGYKKCSGDGCPSSQNCTYGCKTYSSQSGCSDVCTACYDDNCHNRTAVSVPANASCSAYYDDCLDKCSAWACNSGYNKSGNSCVCATTCTDSVTNKPANSTYTTSSCTACGVTTTINTGWTCNSGYTQSGNSCVCATTCKDTATVPANATAVKSTCTACGQTYSIVTGFTCNSGYTKSGNKCVALCTETCEDTYTGSLPANAVYVTENCTACGVTTTIKTGWTCKSGYSKENGSCVDTCSSMLANYTVIRNSDDFNAAMNSGASNLAFVGNVPVPYETTTLKGGTWVAANRIEGCEDLYSGRTTLTLQNLEVTGSTPSLALDLIVADEVRIRKGQTLDVDGYFIGNYVYMYPDSQLYVRQGMDIYEIIGEPGNSSSGTIYMYLGDASSSSYYHSDEISDSKYRTFDIGVASTNNRMDDDFSQIPLGVVIDYGSLYLPENLAASISNTNDCNIYGATIYVNNVNNWSGTPDFTCFASGSTISNDTTNQPLVEEGCLYFNTNGTANSRGKCTMGTLRLRGSTVTIE